MKAINRTTIMALLVLYSCSAVAQTLVTAPMTSTPAAGNYYSPTSITLSPGFSFTASAGQSLQLSIAVTAADCVPLATNLPEGQNYISTLVMRNGGFTNTGMLTNLGTCDALQTIRYIDGLGRPLQTVQVKGSTSLKDIVQPVAYDAFSREPLKYLPYANTNGNNDGSYKTTALSDQPAFYLTPPAGSGVSQIKSPVSGTAFEPSGLNRVVEQGAPGEPWQLTGTTGLTAAPGHTVKMDMTMNDQSSTFSGTSLTNNPGSKIAALYTATVNSDESRTLVRAGNTATYAAGQLIVTISKDENWNPASDGCLNTTEEYKDKEGHVVLKRTYNNNSSAIEMLSTYYVYDDMGNLCFVLPPGANPDAAAAISQAMLDNLGYQYQYDERNRLVQKKLPGKGWDFMIYNTLDQVTFSQDANQRAKSAPEWSYTRYDGQGRVAITGTWNSGDAPDYSLSAPSRVREGWLQNWSYTHTPLWATRDNTTSTGYNDDDPPGPVLTINYYDDYTYPGIPYSSTVSSIAHPAGMPTATWTSVLLPDGSYGYGLWTATYYDALGRMAQNYEGNFKGGISDPNNYDVTTVNTYDFSNAVLAATRQNYLDVSGTPTLATTIANGYVYDHMGRKIQTTEAIASAGTTLPTPVLLSQTDYNEIGQPVTKHLHSTNGGSSFLQNIGYTYNERDWLKTSSAPLFAMQLNYNDGTTPQYNGNISNQLWGTPGSLTNTYTYTYDPLNRLLSGISTNNYSESGITYDVLGNIKTLQRTWGTTTAIDNLSYTYTDGSSNPTNQVQKIIDAATDASTIGYKYNGGTGYTYAYDGNGNMVTDNSKGLTIAYNRLNLPATNTVSGGTITYTYDARGKKLRKASTVGSGSTTDYDDGIQFKSDGTIDFIQTEEGRAFNSGGTYHYEYNLSDHLGDTRLSFDTYSGSTNTTQQDDYTPFGMEISSGTIVSPKNEYLYNGKELQEELGYYDYGHRFMDPVIGRMTSIDRFAEKYYQLSPYQYGGNDPIRHIDVEGDSLMVINMRGADVGHPQVKQRDYYVDSEVGYQIKGFAEEAMGQFSQLSVNNVFRPFASSQISTGNTRAKGLSRHQAGFAVDFNGVKTLSKSELKALNDLAKKFGLAPLTNQSADPPHFDSDPSKHGYDSLKGAVDEDKQHYDDIQAGKAQPVKYDEKKYEETKKKADENKPQ